MAKKIDYKNSAVASYLFIGWIFLIIGLDNNFAIFLIGALFVFLGIEEYNKNKT
ncbi:hypothetical protein ACQKII_13465 [Lysinibacillus sp. NPDC048646]|uniref:hypothetical protein n=1 Tax=Lysinibacillus sp. NPDC048646 TaxID=3390574 RepID=UPI003CFDC3AD